MGTAEHKRSPAALAGIYLRGMAMGAADLVPGVSGGTIALISGIYDELLDALRRLNPAALRLWQQQGLKALWQHLNGTFLLALLAGILTSVLTLAKGIGWLLLHQPQLIWSFFFGLILISAFLIARELSWQRPLLWLALLAGTVLSAWITVVQPIALEPSYPMLFLAGMLAITAMILPGISGSFILLLLGLYAPVLEAVSRFDLVSLGIFACGCVAGLLSFTRLLHALLRRARSLTFAFLTGLMLGSLNKVWPWKEVLSYRLNSKGESVPLLEANLWPQQFEQVSGQPASVVLALLAALAAVALVLGLHGWSRYRNPLKKQQLGTMQNE